MSLELMDVVELRDKNQITIPKKIIDRSNFEVGKKVKVYYDPTSGSILLEVGDG